MHMRLLSLPFAMHQVFVWGGRQIPASPVTSANASWTVTGSHARGRLGASLVGLGNGTLAVGAPWAKAGTWEMAGVVDVFKVY